TASRRCWAAGARRRSPRASSTPPATRSCSASSTRTSPDPVPSTPPRSSPMTSTESKIVNYPFGTTGGLDEHPGYEEARRADGLTRVRMPYGGPAWLVTRYDDIKVVLSDPRFSRSATLGKDVARSTPAIE